MDTQIETNETKLKSTFISSGLRLPILHRYPCVVRHLFISRVFVALTLGISCTGSINVLADFNNPSLDELENLSMMELMDVVVTSPSKKAQPLGITSSAIYVLTKEDIRRSTATSIPELLRGVPGIHVARLDANKWAITSRGFNGRFANKLLVLIDGRSVYTPTFSGVRWNAQDLLLEDIDRIEVIRGPGATLWGANAVNGVINIITRKAEATTGNILSFGGGDQEQAFAGIRHGSKVGKDMHFRVYSKYFQRDEFVDSQGKEAADSWNKIQGGGRFDWNVTETTSMVIQADIFSDETGQTFTFPALNPLLHVIVDDKTDSTGGNIRTQFDHRFSDSAEMSLQIYYDRFKRKDSLLTETVDTLDVDFQNRFSLGENHQIIWGLGYRFMNDRFRNSFALSFSPNDRNSRLYNGFIQDEITVIPDRLQLILGSKVEHNVYTGAEFQPNVRIISTPSKKQTIWAAVSRAIRTPSRAENDTRINNTFIPPGLPQNPLGLPLLVAIFGDSGFEAEDLLAFELGYRLQVTDNLNFDIATFYNLYDDLRTLEPNSSAIVPEPANNPTHFVLPTLVQNKMDGETYGLEIVANWRLHPSLRLTSTYSFLKMALHRDNSSLDTTSENAEGETPEQQFSIRSAIDLPKNLELDVILRYVDNLPALNIKNYFSTDIRFAWKPSERLELSLVGQNLFDDQHPEFLSNFIQTKATETERSFYAKALWKF